MTPRPASTTRMETMAATTSAPPTSPISTTSGTAERAAQISDRVRARWAGMAGRMGLGLSLLGFFVIAIAWSGAAGLDYAQGQLPYLLSGGFGGLGLIVTGAAMTVAESNRRDRVMLEQQLTNLSAAISKLQVGGGTAANGKGDWAAFAQAGPDDVVVGRSSYHRPECRLIAGRTEAEIWHRDDAVSEGLTPCRVCKP